MSSASGGTTGSLASTVGAANPLRYRGYYYDTETGLYYLQTRYYDPQVGRFISADALASTGQGVLGYNMFAYCNNCPVMFDDAVGIMPSSDVLTCCISELGGSKTVSDYIDFVERCKLLGISLYYSIDGALSDWSAEYRPLSKETEYVAFLYSFDTTLGARYFMSHTYRGSGGGFLISPNTIIGTFILVAQNQMSSANLVAQVHTHPAVPEERHNDFPSYANNIYGGDRLACELFGFPEMYIIPYCRCDGTPPIIVYSDSSTWCQNHPY